MSVELIGIVTVGVALAGVILTATRGGWMRGSTVWNPAWMGASRRWNLGLMGWNVSLANCASAWRTWKDCWKDYAKPSPCGRQLAKDGNLAMQGPLPPRDAWFLLPCLLLGLGQVHAEDSQDVGGGWKCKGVDQYGYSQQASNTGQRLILTRTKKATILAFLIPERSYKGFKFPYYETVDLQVDGGKTHTRTFNNGFPEFDLDPPLANALKRGLRARIQVHITDDLDTSVEKVYTYQPHLIGFTAALACLQSPLP